MLKFGSFWIVYFFFWAFSVQGQTVNYVKSDSLKVLAILKATKAVKENRDSVFKLAQKALCISESIKFEKGMAMSKDKIAGYYNAKGDYANAVSNRLEVIEGFEKLGMMEDALMAQVSLSTTYKHMGAERGTVDYLKKGLHLAKEAELKASALKLDNVVIEGLNNQGIILRDLSYILKRPGLMDSAFIKYQKAIKLLEKKEEDPQTLQMLYNNISQVYIERQKNYPKALEVLNKAIAINHKIQNKNNLSYNYANVSNLYNAQKNYPKAKEYAHKMLAIGNELERPHRVLNAYNHLKKISTLTMDYDSAYFYSEKLATLNDSLTNVTKTEQVVEFQTKYETLKKDVEIKDLNRKAELSKFRSWAFIGGLLFLTTLTILVYSRYILKKKSAEELSIKNTEIKQQSDIIQKALTEKETLLREIHHRVKNNLQIISSLLNIQSDGVEDPSVLSSIKEGQSRVQAMSLIHQNLYQSEHINNVDIENYLKELVDYLSEMFAGGSKDVSIEVTANKVEFDIDTAIPLGLIVNELVSNAYKYAFEEHGKGKIEIGIRPLNDTDYELHVKDDGKGLPDDFDPKKSKSLGLKLVKILSKQLRGKFRSESNNGALFVVSFKDLRVYQSHQL